MLEEYCNAFDKIEDWCNENIPRNRKIEINFPHEVYGWDKLVYSYDLGLNILSGSHGWGADARYNSTAEYYGRDWPSKEGCDFRRQEKLEKLVRLWHDYFKPKFEKEIGFYKELKDFKA